MEKAVDFCFRKGKAVGETSRPRVKRRKGEIQTKRNAMERKGKHTCQANQIKSNQIKRKAHTRKANHQSQRLEKGISKETNQNNKIRNLIH